MNRDTEEPETQTASPGKSLVLVVGTNQTATPVPPPLAFAEADAEAMAAVLQERCHFELFQPPLLGEQATSDALRKAVLRLARDRAPEDVILLYFSGHGVQVHDALRLDVRNTYLVRPILIFAMWTMTRLHTFLSTGFVISCSRIARPARL